MNDIYEIIEQASDLIRAMIEDENQFKEVTAAEIGLDPRAGYKLFISPGALVVNVRNASSLDYYGGFEYVDKEYVKIVGEWKIYMSDDGDDRVRDAWDALNKG